MLIRKLTTAPIKNTMIKNFCDSGGADGDSTKAEECRDQRDNEEYHCIVAHDRTLCLRVKTTATHRTVSVLDPDGKSP